MALEKGPSPRRGGRRRDNFQAGKFNFQNKTTFRFNQANSKNEKTENVEIVIFRTVNQAKPG